MMSPVRSFELVVASVVLDPHHTVTKLLIKDYDNKLCHPGPERIFAEIRRSFWVLRGREAIRRPQARLWLQKTLFYSTGKDCFGPFQINIGIQREKWWGIIFKCLTARCVHLDLLTSIDTDSFLMDLRKFVVCRGKPCKLFSDQGTNFHGGEKELQEAVHLSALNCNNIWLSRKYPSISTHQTLHTLVVPGSVRFVRSKPLFVSPLAHKQ